VIVIVITFGLDGIVHTCFLL